MQITTTIHVHVIPVKPSLELDSSDRELVGVYAVEVDALDYPIQHATAARNAFDANVRLQRPDDFMIHLYNPGKKAWLVLEEGDLAFPRDGEFTGKVDTDLLPVGSQLISLQDEMDHDCEDKARITPAGSRWEIVEIDRGSAHVGCAETGATLFVSVCELGKYFRIDPGYSEDVELTAEQLDDKYNPEGGGEHPMHTRRMWMDAVANEDTISGYWNWVESEIAQAAYAG